MHDDYLWDEWNRALYKWTVKVASNQFQCEQAPFFYQNRQISQKPSLKTALESGKFVTTVFYQTEIATY